MNEMAQKYYDTSRPAYCARYGFVDEIVNLSALRGYLKAFAGAVYQNPKSICPRHQMLLPRRDQGLKAVTGGACGLASFEHWKCRKGSLHLLLWQNQCSTI